MTDEILLSVPKQSETTASQDVSSKRKYRRTLSIFKKTGHKFMTKKGREEYKRKVDSKVCKNKKKFTQFIFRRNRMKK